MSLQVYFGDTLIDDNYYTGLTNNFELFSDSFKLGTTPSNTYKLNVAKYGISSQPTSVTLKDSGTTFAELEIDNIEEQDYTYDYTLTDKMLDLDFYYDASEIFINGSTTLLAIAQDICNKKGLTLGTTNFRGYDKQITWYDNRKTARQYIGYIAELNGGFARIENSTLYFRKQKTNSASTIDIDYCENFVIGEYHKITRVVYELGALKYEFGDETGNTLYLNSENVFITEESEVEAIYDDIKNFEFYSFETGNCPIDYSVKAGDVITFTDGTNNYPTIAQYELEYFGTWLGGYSLKVNTERQEETQIVGTKEHVKNLQIIVDRDANKITELVETTEEIEHQFETLQDMTGQVEGKYIYIDDASNELITSAKFNGETSQEIREGYNLIQYSDIFRAGTPAAGITPTVNTDGSLQVVLEESNSNWHTAWWASSQTFTSIENELNEGDKFTIVFTIKKESGTIGRPTIYIKNGMGYYHMTGTVGTDFVEIYYTGTWKDTNSITPHLGWAGCVGTFTIKNWMIKKGEYASYQPYGVMPSLDYPSEITNLVGKNKLNPSDYLQGSFSPSTGGNNNVAEVNNIRVSTKLIDISQFKNNIVYSGDYFDLIAFYDSSLQLITYTLNKTNAIPNNAKYCRLRFYNAGNELLASTMQTGENQLEEGTIATSYAPYNSLEVKVTNEDETETQTVYFPLEDGQKLMEESYLADDGIHNVRRQVVLDGTENWSIWAASLTNVERFFVNLDTSTKNIGTTKCSHFIYLNANQDKEHFRWSTSQNVYKQFVIFIDKSKATTVAELKTWLQSNPITVEYEIEEEIIPYNTDQQAAWNSIRELHTYKNITNIYSDAYAEIGYIKDNMLSAFETKASAQLTKNDVSQLKIENGRISSEVSSTQSQLNNYYTKKEADNNTNSTKAELQNIIQQNKTEIEQTTQAINLRVSSIETNGVDKIETSMGYTFDNDGLNIDKEGAATASTIDNEAFKVKNKSANENVFFAGYVSDQDSAYRGQTIVESTNLVVKNYLNIEGASRFQPYVNPVLGGHGTGAFDIG